MERGGRCLSTKYVNSQTKLRWECSQGHRWWTVPNSVRSGSWCKVCAGLDKPTLKGLHAVAKARGGKCLSDKYKSARTQMHWECAHGHQWKAVWDKIRQGKWCPECATGIGERICRAYFEQLFGVEFPKVRPKWLRSSTGTQLELDGYNKRLSLAFEHHGRQHYERVSYFGQDEMKLSHRKRLDERKRALCAERGIDLIEIPGIPDMLPFENIQNHIRNELERLGRKLPPRWGTKKINLKSAYASPEAEVHLDQLNKIAQSKGGKCLSDGYINDTTKLLWQCKKGHQWIAIPGSIKQGTWCPSCVKNLPNNIQDAYRAARERNGKCLSSIYVNSKEPLRWECSRGHQWNAPLTRMLRGSWCPQCRGRGKTIDNLRSVAAGRGGSCLSENYLGVKSKYLWQCAKGHQWQAIAESVIRGSWCPACARRRPTTHMA